MAGDKTAEAVHALHKTMVLLREELAKKTQTIVKLERRLNLDLEEIKLESDYKQEFTGGLRWSYLIK